MRRGFLVFVTLLLSTVCATAQGFPVTRGNFNAFGEKAEKPGFLQIVGYKRNFKNSADDDITSSVATLPKPEIPQKLKWTKEEGLVNVEFSVNEKGDVFAAKAVSGINELKKPSETAALKSKFSPPTFEGESLRMSGVILYNFVNADTVEISLDKMRVELTPEITRRIMLRQKLHFWIYDLVERLDKGETKAGMNEANFVFKGKAEIQIILTENTPEIIAQLKQAGLEIEKEIETRIIGRIPIEKIAGLAEIEQVSYVSP